MTRTSIAIASLLAVAALASGCANAPSAATPPAEAAALDCRELITQIDSTEQLRHDALDKKESAWKAVVPFAVAGRYASAKSAAADADQRLADLHAEAIRQGCIRTASSPNH